MDRNRVLDRTNINWEVIFVNDERLYGFDFGFKPAKIISKIGNEESTMENPLVITQKYPNFNGQIITEEAVFVNGQICDTIAQWDTGATYSSISRELVNKLGIEIIGKKNIDTTSSSQVMDYCIIHIILKDDNDENNNVPINIKALVSDNIDKAGIGLLIGMDIISLGDFGLSMFDNVMHFSYRMPSQGTIKF